MKKSCPKAGFFCVILQQIVGLKDWFFELVFVSERESEVCYFYATVEEDALVAGLNRQQRVCKACTVDVGVCYLTFESVVIDHCLSVVVQVAAVGFQAVPSARVRIPVGRARFTRRTSANFVRFPTIACVDSPNTI